MMQRGLSCVAAWVLCAGAAAAWQAPGTQQPYNFDEQFAFAADRRALLELLIPGSEEHSYYSCLERQHAGDLAAVAPLLAAWEQRHGRTQRWIEIDHRQKLLEFARQPEPTWSWLQNELGLGFQHEREASGEKPNLPTSLDAALVSEAAWLRRAAQRHGNPVNGVRGAALSRLVGSQLSDEDLTRLLQRLRRADLPGIPEMVVCQLALRDASPFGALEIHKLLTLEQLEECARLEPKLLGNAKFVASWVERLAPGADEDGQFDLSVRHAHLERLEAFTMRLSGAFNSLKAHVLHHRLAHDLAAGELELERLRAYLRLPRSSAVTHPRLLERAGRGEVADLSGAHPTGWANVGDDEPLVRACLEHFLVGAADTSAFDELVEPRYLARVFAETKILAGQGDMERWYALLDDPAAYEALKQRVELRFAPTQREQFDADAPVELELDVKNVSTLLVKVYEIHALNFYAAQKREIDATLELDGLVANEEATYTYDDSPLRRVRRRFAFPQLARPGVFVIEFIGNGAASRAVVRKGGLRLAERIGAAGHVFRVLDERGVHHKDARLHFEGRQLEADERGEIVLPFSASPGRKPLVVQAGARVALEHFEHRGESLRLELDSFVERESLRSGETARLLVRPHLYIADQAASLALLESSVLTIKTVDFDGVPSSLHLRGLAFNANGELVQEIAVPQRLRSLTVSLAGRVTGSIDGNPVELSAQSRELAVNQIEAQGGIKCPLLGRDDQGWFVDMLGKNGEPYADYVMRLTFSHRDYRDDFDVTLMTDAAGRIRLGALGGIEAVRTNGFAGNISGWRLDDARASLPGVLHAVRGQTLRVPYPHSTPLSRETVSLLEVRGELALRDAYNKLALAGGFLELRELAPGDYRLVLHESGAQVLVSVTNGVARDGWALGAQRALELGPTTTLGIGAVRVEGDTLVVQLGGAGADARVHVFSTRYAPAFDVFDAFWGGPQLELSELALGAEQSDLRSGRAISDEFRYILERRFARKFPGNLLARPSLLLNRFALDVSSTNAADQSGSGGAYGGRFGGKKDTRARGGATSGSPGASGMHPSCVPNFDFLDGTRGLAANLRPDAQGVVRVPLAQLGDGQHVHVLALDARQRAYRALALPAQPLRVREQRLASSLDVARRLSEQRSVEFVASGATLEFDERASGGAKTYDALDDVFGYFRTVDGGLLDQFEFLPRWPKLTPEEQRARYSQYACHELNLFLARKDPAFFEAVVRPHLANKRDKTFLDHWLLGEPLERYLEPWAFAQLNIVERILLTQRLPGRAASGTRHVQELFELVPPDVARDEWRFSVALAGRDLSRDTSGGLVGSDEFFIGQGAQAQFDAAKNAPGAPPPTAAPMAPAGKPGADAKRKSDERQEVAEESESAVAEPSGPASPGPAASGPGGDSVVTLGFDLEQDKQRRAAVRRLYQPLATTAVFAETNYFGRRASDHNANLVTVNAFWLDFAKSGANAPFVSKHFMAASGHANEMLLALALLDLPFEAGAHKVESRKGRTYFTAANGLLVARKDLRELESADAAAPLLVSQDFVRLDDRFEFVGSQQRDKLVRGEFLVAVPYGCRVVVTNPSSTPREVELLLQVPAGSIPLGGARRTRGERVQIGAYGTQSVEYGFYFPAPGKFAHYPVHVAENGRIAAAAQPATIVVAAEPAAADTTSWEYVSQRGSSEQVLAHLAQANLQRIDLARIAWRMRERAFYDATLKLLRERMRYDDVLWSYSVRHRDTAGAREYLPFQAGLCANSGPWLDTPLVRIDPVARRAYEQLEFDPLVNPRAHPFGRQREILNSEFAAQYQRFLWILTHRPALDAHDWMSATYYLLLQDRIEEALAAFAKVDAAALNTRLQYDYFRAYLAFFGDTPQAARPIAEAYRTYPVARWRSMFGDVLSQLDELSGAKPLVGDPRDRDQRQNALAASEPALSLELAGSRVVLGYANLAACEVSYYPMDIEFLFSSNPFVQQDSGAFAFIKPKRSDTLQLPSGAAEHSFELPAEFRTANVLIEVRAGALVRRKPCLQGSLRVQWLENAGQLAVTSSVSGKPLPKAYVKVYARGDDGIVRFHKDGYTDLRGRFDYVSLSGEGVSNAARYAVLVASESEGATIGEAAPPAK